MPDRKSLKKTVVDTQPLHVIMVDDDEDDYLLTLDMLKDIPGKQFNVTWLDTYSAAQRYIQDETAAPHLFFYDYRLGSKNSVELIRSTRQKWLDVPIIVLTGKGDRGVDETAMHAGATDYLVKSGLDSNQIERSIRYALERAATLQSLRESETKYRRIFVETQNMICVMDAKGHIIDVNPAATSLLGYSRAEFLTMYDHELFVVPNEHEVFISTLLKHGETREYEVLFRAKNGEPRQCLLSAVLQKNSEEDYYFHVLLHDITGRRRAEMVRLLSEKLATIDRFVQALAHEVRNPLTNVDLAMAQLDAENSDSDLEDLIAIVQRNSKRISNLITELLHVSRKPELAKTPTSVRQLLLDSLVSAADRATLKNIRIETEWPEKDLIISADASKMQMAMLNLYTNAFEAMEDGKGVLNVSYALRDNECCISVRDNGCGIPKESLGHLFEPYFTVKPRGMGLGLTTVLNIIQSHSGSVTVDSIPGEGTHFKVWLPLDQEVDALPAQ